MDFKICSKTISSEKLKLEWKYLQITCSLFKSCNPGEGEGVLNFYYIGIDGGKSLNGSSPKLKFMYSVRKQSKNQCYN